MIRFVQHNLNRQREATHSTLESSLALGIDVILLQEPYSPKIGEHHILIHHPAYHTISSVSSAKPTIRPQVVVYIRKQSGIQFTPRFDLCDDPDIQIIEIIGTEEPFLIFNIYNEKQQTSSNPGSSSNSSPGPYTINRLLLQFRLQQPTLIAGDFNLHYTWWNSGAEPTRVQKSTEFVNWLRINNISLMNDVEIMNSEGGTFFRSNLKSESIIDLAFTRGFRSTK